MQSKLVMTKKDKKLLSGLCCFLIFVGFLQFLILPAWRSKQSAKQEVANLQLEITTMQSTIDEMTNEAKSLNQMKERLSELKKIFNASGNVEDVEEQLTNLALSIGLSSNSITLQSQSSQLVSHSSASEELTTEENVSSYQIIHQLSCSLSSTVMVYLEQIQELENVLLNQVSMSYDSSSDSESWTATVVLTYYEHQE